MAKRTATGVKKEELEDDSPSLNYGRTPGKEFVDIFVGPKKELFRVHKGPLLSKCPYLNGIYPTNTGVGKETFTIPDLDPEIFGMFVQWVYTGVYSRLEITSLGQATDGFMHRIKLLGFAKKIACSELVDYTMSALISSYNLHAELPSTEAMTLAYSVTLSLFLRDFMAQCLHYKITVLPRLVAPSAECSTLMASIPELALRVIDLMRITSGKITADPRKSNPCDYHIRCVSASDCPYKKERF